MEIGREERVRMERAHVRAWPALQTLDLDGWLWRSSGGGSQRANSVSTIDFHGNDPEATIAKAEACYRAAGAPARFHTFDDTSPPGLGDLLRARGYRETDPTVTMFKRTERQRSPVDVETRDEPWVEWRDVYLSEITENRRAVNTLILDRIPAPRAFFGRRHDGRIAATALCAIGFDCAVVECVTTRSGSRRLGAAQSVMTALEAWAAQQTTDWIGLQVVPTNTPAINLYKQRGFVHGATNRFWLSPSTPE